MGINMSIHVFHQNRDETLLDTAPSKAIDCSAISAASPRRTAGSMEECETDMFSIIPWNGLNIKDSAECIDTAS